MKTIKTIGLHSDDGGHPITHMFMKDQDDKNLFPQDSNLNRGSYEALENDYTRVLKSKGTEAHFSHKLDDFDDTGRPGKISVQTDVYRHGDLFDTIKHVFSNQSGKQYERRY